MPAASLSKYVEILPRQSGKSTRLIKAVNDAIWFTAGFMNANIVVPNVMMMENVIRQFKNSYNFLSE